MKKYLIAEGSPVERYWGDNNKSAKKKCSKTVLLNAFINKEVAEQIAEIWEKYSNQIFKVIEIEGECEENEISI